MQIGLWPGTLLASWKLITSSWQRSREYQRDFQHFNSETTLITSTSHNRVNSLQSRKNKMSCNVKVFSGPAHTHTHTILPGSVKQEKLQSILPLWNSICKKPGSWNATLPSWLLRGLSLIGLCWENGRGRTAKKQPQSGRFFLLPGELMPMFQSSHSQGLGRHTLRNPAVTACRSSLLGHVCQAKAHWRMKCEDTTHNQKKCTMCKSEERENWALVLSWVRKEQLIIQRKCEWTSGRAAIFDKINL